MDSTYLLWAVSLGGLSAVSLPLGSAVWLALRPSLSTAAVLAAFGAGALIAAVTIELVAPTVQHIGESGGHAGAAAFWILAAGALAGGLLFVAVDRALASRGGFLRKVSTAIGWFTREARQRNESYLKELCAIPLLWKLPSEQVELLIRDVRAESYSEDETLFEEGEVADELFFVRSGEVELSRGGEHVRTVGAGGIFGELPLLAGIPRTVSAQAKGRVEALVLRGADFERWRKECPEFDLGFRRSLIWAFARWPASDWRRSASAMQFAARWNRAGGSRRSVLCDREQSYRARRRSGRLQRRAAAPGSRCGSEC